jgi:hypothetical protein
LARRPTTCWPSRTKQAEHCNRWRHAAQLLLDQAEVAAVSRQVYLALFYEAQLKAMD